MNNSRQNEGIIRFASTIKDRAISLRAGGSIIVDWLPEEDNDGIVYYVSIDHDKRVVSMGFESTEQTINTCSDIETARKETLSLARKWNYEVEERV
jgi:hypothetical protein